MGSMESDDAITTHHSDGRLCYLTLVRLRAIFRSDREPYRIQEPRSPRRNARGSLTTR